jgi:hypothetical protein
MRCENSDNCIYYKNYRFKSNSNQFRALAESYCEGDLKPMCRRLRYKAEVCKEAPEDLAPNGYIVGPLKKLSKDKGRKFERYKIKNGTCLLQVLDTENMFNGEIVDVSEGGMRLELDTHPEGLNICSKKSFLKILGYSSEDIPFPLNKEIVKMVWQNNRVIGCSF